MLPDFFSVFERVNRFVILSEFLSFFYFWSWIIMGSIQKLICLYIILQELVFQQFSIMFAYMVLMMVMSSDVKNDFVVL